MTEPFSEPVLHLLRAETAASSIDRSPKGAQQGTIRLRLRPLQIEQKRPAIPAAGATLFICVVPHQRLGGEQAGAGLLPLLRGRRRPGLGLQNKLPMGLGQLLGKADAKDLNPNSREQLEARWKLTLQSRAHQAWIHLFGELQIQPLAAALYP